MKKHKYLFGINNDFIIFAEDCNIYSSLLAVLTDSILKGYLSSLMKKLIFTPGSVGGGITSMPLSIIF